MYVKKYIKSISYETTAVSRVRVAQRHVQIKNGKKQNLKIMQFLLFNKYIFFHGI